VCVPFGYLYFSYFSIMNQNWALESILAGMALTPFPSSILDETRFKPTTFWTAWPNMGLLSKKRLSTKSLNKKVANLSDLFALSQFIWMCVKSKNFLIDEKSEFKSRCRRFWMERQFIIKFLNGNVNLKCTLHQGSNVITHILWCFNGT